ncbi:MAG: hypothetical protein NZ735_07725, partial [Candidatus Marinimicrobia bacterium]|nr:hypothetical protein [Candidatus Neomarinimicrobiota bacterium]
RGEYIPTGKNGLVRSLYKTLGFKKVDTTLGDNTGKEEWVYANYDLKSLSPKHYVSVKEI